MAKKGTKRKKLLLGNYAFGVEHSGGSYLFNRRKDKNKQTRYIAYVDVQPKYKVTFIKHNRKTGKYTDGNIVEFDKKTNVTKLLKSKGFVDAEHQSSFKFPSDSAFEKKKISIGLKETKRKTS